ncbi:hypothetical protein HYALB_00012750 [Hymenoscyphus albidus]|uniref:Mitochondrial intermediate peptidase n=1 Tax=Hymenoscyphus albidus TaxID=595503 RepID=A0A9N9LX80_9HELO|nr:hypothetical protein HYALB_00012750 [Hymenoscyphus albidus]
MLKAATTRSRICSRCIRRQQQQPFRRPYSVASASPLHTYDPRDVLHTSAPGAVHDDKILRQIFDSPSFWKDFSQHSKAAYEGPNYGLFQNKYLTSPQGFEVFAQASLKRARRIVDEVRAAKTKEEYQAMVRKLDRLSDLLCRVIDLSDFVRSTHPNPEIQAAATNAHGMMYEYMNVLNVETRLAEQLRVAMKDHQAGWGEPEKMVAHILENDFEKSGIYLPKAQKQRFVALSQEIESIGFSFTDTMTPVKDYISFKANQLTGINPLLLQQFSSGWGNVTIPTVGWPSVMALQTVKNPDVRKDIYKATRTASQRTIRKLESFLKRRAELAKLVDFESYGHRALDFKMAGNPENVQTFLRNLNYRHNKAVAAQFAELQAAKSMDAQPRVSVLQPWDKDYYMAQILQKNHSKKRRPDFLHSYFSLGTVMQGLSRLFSRLYGIRLVPKETLRGETWNPDVRRLDVISETEGRVAVLYCDLFARPGKSPNPAHFTLRCSRWISDEEIDECRAEPDSLFATPEEAATDGMATSTEGKPGGIMQLPTIALICDFAVSESQKPAFLTFTEVTTLFHEMGHAIHSILGRTEFQNISGTRVASDFAELPSILMEHFAADETVLSMFARHYETDEPLPYEMVSEQLAIDQKLEAFDVNNQIILSLLDQALHSDQALHPSFNSTEIYHDLQRLYSLLPPDPKNTCWQGFFGHLYGYGGMYYSYLFDRALARRVWKTIFKSGEDGGSVSRENGERFKEHVLSVGGGRDPWDCLADAMGDERLSSGADSRSRLDLVGSWGLRGK